MNVSLEDCVDRLSQFGYDLSDDDKKQLDFDLQKLLDYTANYCNLESVEQLPNVLVRRVIDRVCAEFLFYKKNTGQLSDFDYSVCLKAIEQGDTKVTYGVGQDNYTPESRFDKTVDNLTKGYDKWICKYRVMRW